MLKCEGPSCNAGHSAADREAALLPIVTTATLAEFREEQRRQARIAVNRQLAYTPHVPARNDSWGRSLYRCDICGWERIFGNLDAGVSGSDWGWPR